jgi:hypothetical protein
MTREELKKISEDIATAALWLRDFVETGNDPADQLFLMEATKLKANSELLSQFARRKMFSIKLKDCVNGGLYHVYARNFNIGVYNEKAKGFIGIREKFGKEYLDTEYYWDEPQNGTCQPSRFIEMCPLTNVSQGEFCPAPNDGIYKQNKELFDWLKVVRERVKKESYL